MRKVLVTGGAGFIGSHLVRALVSRGDSVRVIDNFNTGRKENLNGCLKDIRLIKGDIRDQATFKKAVRGVSHLFHLAAISSVPASVDNPVETFDVNVNAVWKLMETSRLAGVKRIIFVSSASVYGADSEIPFKETMRLRGSSPYATSKLIGEQLCDLYGNLYGLETVALRFFSVYGPCQNRRSQYANVIPAFVTCCLNGTRPTIYGDGRQTRDFVFVGDIVRAMLQASRLKKAVGEVINIGSGRQTSVLQLLSAIQKILRTDIEPIYKRLKPGDDPATCADIGKAVRMLGMSRITPFESGLSRTVRWFKEDLARNR